MTHVFCRVESYYSIQERTELIDLPSTQVIGKLRKYSECFIERPKFFSI